MNDDLIERIAANPKFAQLVAKKSSFTWILTLIMLVIYFGFILLIAFSPATLGTPLSAGSVTTIGIPVGLFVIVAAFVLTGIYVKRANVEFDDLARQVVEESRS